MVHPDLLDILVCPETHARLQPAESDLLDRINAAIAAGTLLSQGGQKIRSPLEGGLVREDGLLLYPVRDEIPVMLLDEAIPLDSLP